MLESLIGIGVCALAAMAPVCAWRWWKARRECDRLWLQHEALRSEHSVLQRALQRKFDGPSTLRVVR